MLAVLKEEMHLVVGLENVGSLLTARSTDDRLFNQGHKTRERHLEYYLSFSQEWKSFNVVELKYAIRQQELKTLFVWFDEWAFDWNVTGGK